MNKTEKLKRIKQKMLADQNLPLRQGATNLVFGDGNPNASYLFIGEGPGYWEDQKGIPFVGNAGALLDQMLSLIGISRKEVFITNVVHYRPPGNRDPEESEIAAFQPYLDEIIDVIEPKVIVTLGRFSMAKFLTNAKISQVHGKAFAVNWKGNRIIVVPMYHPAAGLRSSEIKSILKQDFLKLPEMVENFDNLNKEAKVEQGQKNLQQMQLI